MRATISDLFLPILLSSAASIVATRADAQQTETVTPAPTAVAAQATDAAPAPAPVPVQLFRFEGAYLDLPEAGGDITGLLLGGGVSKPKSFYEMRDELADLATSESEHILFDLTRAFSLNAPQMAELERTFGTLREKGKKTYAYVENAGLGTYQLAAMCDVVMMADLGSLDLPSLSMEVMFMKDALDLLGVGFDIVRCGDFKGAVEPYMQSTMSKHLRSHYLAMLERINQDIAQRIAKHRRIGVTEVRGLQAVRMLSPKDALAAKLVDHIVPWRGAEHAMRLVCHDLADLEINTPSSRRSARKSFNPMDMWLDLFRPAREEEIEDPTLVVLHLSGQIVDGTKPAAGSIVSGPTVATIRSLIDNEEVEGVVVRVNSPGGSATASEAILLALQDLAAVKPVVFSMGTLAASGGYYVTCVGRPVLAEAGTITGSIGVFGMRPNLGALLRRVGVHNEVIALDESGEMMAMDRPWSESQKATVQRHVNDIYDVFIGHVSRARNLPTADVMKIAGGRVWSGEQAVANGLVDRIGGIDEALAMVAKEAAVTDYEVQHLPKPKSFMDTFAQELMEASIVLPDAAKLSLLARAGLDRVLRIVLDSLQDDRPVRVMALLPETFVIR